ncbi:endoplasmic reticulum lectin 1 isoform X2 [Anabrus simplex]|uniref:endoplasmic reticulum lectin 1 isoform X2 n=1 Tax=Anabrus simplex TaxID=316456 RepID=UPI0035A3C71B
MPLMNFSMGRSALFILCTLFFYIGYGIEIKGFDDSVLYKINWPGSGASDILDGLGFEPLVVTTEHNEKYKCLLPQSQSKEKDSEEIYEGPNPLDLLSPVFTPTSTCSYRLESYWTYELCHGRHIRQYHEEREGKKVKQQEYFLGKWDNTQRQKLREELENSKNLNNIPMKKIDGVNMPYLQINMTDGTVCDLNQKPRFTRVLYVCYAHGKHEISSLKETSTCEYEVIVLSPNLCKHPKYKPQESGENIINCHPLEGTPKKPKDLLALEAESLKLKQQKISDGETKLRVEIHPVEMSIDTVEPEPPSQMSRAMVDTSAASSFLSGKHCLVGGSGWWRYEFCYGTSIDQFHQEKDGTRTVVHLGRFDKAKHLEWLEKNPHKRPKPKAVRKHVSHLYSGGSICDLTGRPRQTEVKLKCAENIANPGQVALFMYEPKTCEYVLGVESLLLCDYIPKADDNGFFTLEDDTADLADEVTVSSEEDDPIQETSPRTSSEDSKTANKLENTDL